MELQKNTHHVYRLMYHFVWIPKYRHKVFREPYSKALKGIIEKIGYDYNIDIVELEIPEDHLHMVVRGVPKMSPSDVMRIINSPEWHHCPAPVSRGRRRFLFSRTSAGGCRGAHWLRVRVEDRADPGGAVRKDPGKRWLSFDCQGYGFMATLLRSSRR